MAGAREYAVGEAGQDQQDHQPSSPRMSTLPGLGMIGLLRRIGCPRVLVLRRPRLRRRGTRPILPLRSGRAGRTGRVHSRTRRARIVLSHHAPPFARNIRDSRPREKFPAQTVMDLRGRATRNPVAEEGGDPSPQDSPPLNDVVDAIKVAVNRPSSLGPCNIRLRHRLRRPRSNRRCALPCDSSPRREYGGTAAETMLDHL